ncbi:hypothetical protein AX774_g6800 [Zancudomyces culisetae]|uniref:Uncharacterized protein n=1 Tax=Zancudomyces culisetae TaxID=1213189 RepID=A0A1R1PFP2_ZANCU|nr:hypothetical protein AX774_g6800 [Zancudomyces culisetae]|eukprot:OMH79777.1 hypothetical protein AX774_g6800 [Zancudomyces culisetae]
MNSENNSNNLFNRLPASTLSTIFVLAQNPQLSLLNKNMYKASQKVETVSDYILQYALSNTENSFTRNLSDMFEKYTKINMNEAIVGILL